MDVILIAAVTANGMIARSELAVVNWSKDLDLFRKQTMGQTVIMGSKTAQTLSVGLKGRKVIVMHRDMEPKEVLKQVKTPRCFIIGGAKTYSRFSDCLTHLYLTIHPLIFPSNAVPLFHDLKREMTLKFIQKIEVDTKEGIYQFQYAVIRPTNVI